MNRFLRAIFFICLLFTVVLLPGITYSQEIRLVIVYSDSLKSSLRTMKGIQSSIGHHYEEVVYQKCFLSTDKTDISKKISSIEKYNPKLILTVGSFATREISDRIKNKSIIFSAVLNPITSGFVKALDSPGGNITGASLDIPPDIQFMYFKRVVQDIKKIGVLYSDETANLIPPAKTLAQEAGLELVAIKISTEKDMPKALETLIRECDGLWSVADSKIFSPRSTRYIILNSLRNGKPFMGFSRNLVESGALFALDFDYKDIGRQAGKIAVEVLSGKNPSAISVAVPGIIWFHYNEKTAGHINASIPEDLSAIAKEVYR